MQIISNKICCKDIANLKQTIIKGNKLSQTNNISRIQLISNKIFCKAKAYLKQTIFQGYNLS